MEARPTARTARRRILRPRHYQPPPIPTRASSDADSESELAVAKKPDSALHAFTSSRFPGKQDIALLLLVRRWREIAAASAARREQLVTMWREAFVFRRRALVHGALATLRARAEVRAQSTENQYEKVQVQLATMHYRQLVLRRTMDRLMHARELAHCELLVRRLIDRRLVERCWLGWARMATRSRMLALERAARAVAHTQRQARVGDALRCWRVQLAELRFAASEKRTSPVKQTLVRWRDAAAGRRLHAMEQTASLVVVHRVFARWHNALRGLVEASAAADSFYEQILLRLAVDQLYIIRHEHQEQARQADRYRRFTLLQHFMQRLVQDHRVHRDELQQSRALREWARHRDQKRRRVVLMVWHKMATARGRINKKRVANWLADAQTMTSFQNEPVCDHIVAVQSDDLEKRELELRAMRAEEEAERYRALLAESRVMLSEPDDPLDREQAQAEQTNEQLDARLDELLGEWKRGQRFRMLSRTLQRMVQVYDQAFDARILRQEQELLEQERQLRREDELREQELQLRREDELREQELQLRKEDELQEQHEQQHLAQDQERKLHDADLQLMRTTLRGWQMVAQSQVRIQARKTERADRFYNDLTCAANINLCRDAWNCLSRQFKTRRQLEMAADKLCWARAAGDLFNALSARVRKFREMEAQADVYCRFMLLRRVMDVFFIFAHESVVERSRRNAAPEEECPQEAELDVILEQVDLEELAVYFGAWREVALDMRTLEVQVADRLPLRLQQLAYAGPDGQFTWETMHLDHLARSAIAHWRQQLSARQAVRQPQLVLEAPDSAQAMQLQKGELKARQNAQRLVLHRWMAVCRGRLLESQKTVQTLESVVRTVSERARLVRLAQT
ncbi:hypothetical protein H4R23_003923, partial [Coemansia sp. Cherry 401B]